MSVLFKIPMWLAKPPGFPFKFLARLSLPNRDHILKAVEMLPIVVVFRKALEVHFLSLNWAQLSSESNQTANHSENNIFPRSYEFGEKYHLYFELVLFMDIPKWSYHIKCCQFLYYYAGKMRENRNSYMFFTDSTVFPGCSHFILDNFEFHSIVLKWLIVVV